jgi:hypothetical protein
MYMRYAGGGVGHYKVTPSDTPADANQEDIAMDDDIDPPNLEGLDDDIDDCHSDTDGEEEDEENLDEDDLGAEDGEGGYLDAEDEEGYAAL